MYDIYNVFYYLLVDVKFLKTLAVYLDIKSVLNSVDFYITDYKSNHVRRFTCMCVIVWVAVISDYNPEPGAGDSQPGPVVVVGSTIAEQHKNEATCSWQAGQSSNNREHNYDPKCL